MKDNIELGVFYNTNKSTPQEVAQYQAVNIKQDLKVLSFLKAKGHIGRWFEKHFIGIQIYGEYSYNKGRVTSVGRSLNTLMNKGLVEKSDWVDMGPYGKSSHGWRVAPLEKGQMQFPF